MDYARIAGITTREKNDAVAKEETLLSLQAAVASIPAYARIYFISARGFRAQFHWRRKCGR